MTTLKPIRDNILATKGDFGDMETRAGIIIKSNVGKSEGITARWFQIAAVGPEQKHIEPGMWVYVEHGRWTEGFTYDEERYWQLDPNGCLAASWDEPKNIVNIGIHEGSQRKDRV